MGSPEQSAGYGPAQVEVVHGLEGTVNYLAGKMQLDPNFFDVHSFAARDVAGKGIQDVATWLEAIDFKDAAQLPGKVRIGFDGYTFDPQQKVSGKLEELPRNELVGALAVTEAKLQVIQREAPEAYASLIGRTKSSLREVHQALDAAFYRKQNFGSYLTAPAYASERGRIRLGIASIPGVITIASMILASCKGQGVVAPPTETGSTGPEVVLTATPVEAPATATAMPPYLGLETATPDSNGEAATAVPELVSGTRITFAENLTDENSNGIQDEIEAALEENGVAVGPEFASTAELVEYVETANQTIKKTTLKNAKGGEIPISSTTFVFRDGVGWMLVPRAIDGSIVVSDNGNGYPVRFTDGTLSELMDDTYHLVADSQNSTVELDETGRMVIVEGEAPLKEYLSCVDSELTENIKKGFVEKMGMTVEDYFNKIILLGKYNEAFYIFKEEGNTQADYVLMGASEVSLANIKGSEVGDSAFCMYFADDTDPSIMIPVVIAYTYQGEFHKTSWVHDGFETGAHAFSLNSMEEIEKWWEDDSKKPSIGDVFVINYHSFRDVDTYDKVAELDQGTQSPFPAEVSRLLRLMGNDYLQRIAGVQSPLDAAKELKADLGDIGLFPNLVALKEANPLSK